MSWLLSFSFLAAAVVNAMQFRPPGYSPEAYKLNLTVSNPSNSSVQIRVQFHGLPLESSLEAVIIASDTYSVSLPKDLNLADAERHSKSVQLVSSGDILVWIHADYGTASTNSAGGFAVLPTASLTKNYIVATHCSTGNCIILVTSVEDTGTGNNWVTIKLRIQQDGSARYRGDSYKDNEEINERNLRIGESMQVICSCCDMSGTHVQGNMKLAVFAGGEFTTLLNSRHQDTVVEQMIPMESIGQEYVLDTSFSPAVSQLIKVVVLREQTQFYYQDQCYMTSKEREVFSFNQHGGAIVDIIGDGQIFIAQFLYNLQLGIDSIMNLPAPVCQWALDYWLYACPADKAFLSLILLNGSSEHLQVQNATPAGLKIEPPYELQLLQLDGCHLVTVSCTHADCRPFSAFVVHSATHRSWSYTPRKSTPDSVSCIQRDMTSICITSDPPKSSESITNVAISTTPTSEAMVNPTTLPSSVGLEQILTTGAQVKVSADDLSSSQAVGESITDVTTIARSTAPPSFEKDDLTSSNYYFTSAVAIEDDSTPHVRKETVTSSTSHSEELCCFCTLIQLSKNGTLIQAIELRSAIRSHLMLDRKKLSSYIRTKMSMSDSRRSAQVIGAFFVTVVIAAVFSLFILTDGFLKDLHKPLDFKKQKQKNKRLKTT